MHFSLAHPVLRSSEIKTCTPAQLTGQNWFWHCTNDPMTFTADLQFQNIATNLVAVPNFVDLAWFAADFMRAYNDDSTSIRRPFDCLSKVTQVTVT